ncbi:MAG: hypothetical protein QM749_03550 [Aquabacterium sp.]
MAQSPSNVFLQEMEHLLLRQQEPILMLKLTMYATDAMRVLMTIRQQADVSPNVEEVLRGICPDWRNPGAIEDPADLIAQALFYSVDSLQKACTSMERVIRTMQASLQP